MSQIIPIESYIGVLKKLNTLFIADISPDFIAIFGSEEKRKQFIEQLMSSLERKEVQPEFKKVLINVYHRDMGKIINNERFLLQHKSSAPSLAEVTNFIKHDCTDEYTFLKVVRYALFVFSNYY